MSRLARLSVTLVSASLLAHCSAQQTFGGKGGAQLGDSKAGVESTSPSTNSGNSNQGGTATSNDPNDLEITEASLPANVMGGYLTCFSSDDADDMDVGCAGYADEASTKKITTAGISAENLHVYAKNQATGNLVPVAATAAPNGAIGFAAVIPKEIYAQSSAIVMRGIFDLSSSNELQARVNVEKIKDKSAYSAPIAPAGAGSAQAGASTSDQGLEFFKAFTSDLFAIAKAQSAKKPSTSSVTTQSVPRQ